MFHWNERGCRKYQIRMEDYVGAAPPAAESDPELAAHLCECGKCREAFAAAELSGRLFSEGGEPEVHPSEAFVTRVMASIREEEALRSSPAPVWRSLEALASRFALVASLALLALSVFLGEVSPALRQTEAVSTGATTTEISSDWPEPPAQPATQDEVLMSLVDVENGILISDRRKAAALVALVFVLGIAFGVVGVLAGRRVLSAGRRGGSSGQGVQQISDLARDLHLTADQERQYRQILADTRERYNAIRDAMDPQFRQIREQNRDRIRQILTAEQKPLFEEFLSESRNRRNEQVSGTRNDSNGRDGRNDQNGNRNDSAPLVARLTQQLRLTGEQQTQLSGILRDTRASFDALRQEMNPQFEEARLQNRERLRQIVTPEQRQGLDAFFQRRDEERRRK